MEGATVGVGLTEVSQKLGQNIKTIDNKGEYGLEYKGRIINRSNFKEFILLMYSLLDRYNIQRLMKKSTDKSEESEIVKYINTCGSTKWGIELIKVANKNISENKKGVSGRKFEIDIVGLDGNTLDYSVTSYTIGSKGKEYRSEVKSIDVSGIEFKDIRGLIMEMAKGVDTDMLLEICLHGGIQNSEYGLEDIIYMDYAAKMLLNVQNIEDSTIEVHSKNIYY